MTFGPFSSDTIQSMNAGLEHVVALDGNGTVWAWGKNTSGQLGDGTYVSSSVPQPVHLPTDVVQVAAGQNYSLALAAGGTQLYAWGDNGTGELGVASSTLMKSDVPVQVHVPLSSGTTITSIADGGKGAFATLSNGDVVGWGANQHGQAGESPKTTMDVFQPAVIPGLANVVSVAGGDHQTLALKTDGTVWAWGADRYGQLGPNGPRPTVHSATDVPVEVSGLPKIVAIATGGEHSIALDAQGNLWTWGRNAFGQLGWGTIDKTNGPNPVPHQVVSLSDITSVDGEGPTTLAADASGNVYCWGFNKQGEVGDATKTNTGTPQLVESALASPSLPPGSVHVTSGHWFNDAYNANTGQIDAWGRNTYGELGSVANHWSNVSPSDQTSLFGSDVFGVDNTAAEVYALYAAVLGQQPDPLSLARDVASIDAGGSTASLAETLLSSHQYRSAHGAYQSTSNQDFVNTLYEAAFGHTPSQSEAANYVAALKQGTSRPTVAADVATSPETLDSLTGTFAKGVFVVSETAATIARLSYCLLGQPPHAEGLAHDEGMVADGTSLDQIAAKMITHAPAEGLHADQTNSAFVTALFEAVNGTSGGSHASAYVWQLDQGTPRSTVAVEFVDSRHVADHFAPQIEIGRILA